MKKAIFVLVVLLVSMCFIKIQLAISEEQTLQSLIDNASPYDTIYLPSGTYYEHLQVLKPLIIIGGPTTIDGNYSGACMYIHPSYPYSRESVTVKNIVVQNAQGGFILDLCSNIIIENCTILNMIVDGIMTYDARDQTIKNNVFLNNYNAMDFWGIGNTIVGNYFENTTSNALHIGGYNNTVEGNTFVNSNIGIYVACYSDYNLFYHNTFINSSWANMQIHLSHSNLIYYNNFFKGVGEQVILEGYPYENYWNKSKVGNYWSTYEGVDLNHDGIGDTSYVLAENNVDFYPLMQDPPFIPPPPRPPATRLPYTLTE